MAKELSRNEWLASQGEPIETPAEKTAWKIRGRQMWARGVALLNQVRSEEAAKIEAIYALGEDIERKLDLGA